MKLCFIMDTIHGYGGIERMQATLSNELSKRHSIAIIEVKKRDAEELPFHLSPDVCIYNKYEENRRNIFRKALTFINRKTGILNTKGFSTILLNATFARRFRKKMIEHINNEKYDIVIAIAGMPTIILGAISEEISAKTICWERNTYERYFVGENAYYKNRTKLLSKSLSKVDECIVLTKDIQKKYLQHLGISPRVMYNARSFVSDKKSPVSSPVFVACGRFVPYKGFDLLIQAFKEFSEHNSEWSLVLVGDGKQRPNLEDMIRDLCLSDRITITGFADNVKEYLLASSIFLMSLAALPDRHLAQHTDRMKWQRC